MKIYILVSGNLRWPRWVLHLSLWYGHVMLVSGYLVLTAVNWPWNGSPISNFKDVRDMHKLMWVDLYMYIFFGRYLAWFSCLINILRDYISACNMVMWYVLVLRFLVLRALFWHGYPMSWSWWEPLWLPSLHGLGRHKTIVVRDYMHPWTMPLASMTMKSKMHELLSGSANTCKNSQLLLGLCFCSPSPSGSSGSRTNFLLDWLKSF